MPLSRLHFFNAVPWMIPAFDDANAPKAVLSYIDYYAVRAIKDDLSLDEVDTYMYDRDAGNGAFARVVLRLRGGN